MEKMVLAIICEAIIVTLSIHPTFNRPLFINDSVNFQTKQLPNK